MSDELKNAVNEVLDDTFDDVDEAAISIDDFNQLVETLNEDGDIVWDTLVNSEDDVVHAFIQPIEGKLFIFSINEYNDVRSAESVVDLVLSIESAYQELPNTITFKK